MSQYGRYKLRPHQAARLLAIAAAGDEPPKPEAPDGRNSPADPSSLAPVESKPKPPAGDADSP